MNENELSKLIVGAAIEAHRELGGPGLLEDVYEEALCHELNRKGLQVQRQVRLPILYKGEELARPLILDVVVEDMVIVEAKAVDQVHPVHKAQLLTYLRIANKKLGLLINFGEAIVSKGIHRVVNGLQEE